jgi:hypothetical protein
VGRGQTPDDRPTPRRRLSTRLGSRSWTARGLAAFTSGFLARRERIRAPISGSVGFDWRARHCAADHPERVGGSSVRRGRPANPQTDTCHSRRLRGTPAGHRADAG